MFNALGKFAVKFRIPIILGWILIAAAMFVFAPSLSEVGTMSESSFLPADSESLRARELIEQYFPDTKAASTASLVFYNPQGLSDEDYTYAKQVQQWLTSGQTDFKVETITSIFNNPQLESRLVSPDGTTMLLNAGLEEVAFESQSFETTKFIRNYLETAPEGLDIYVSGQVGVYADLFDSIEKSVTLTTIVTIILVVVLLIIIYRSPIAAIVPLLTIGVAFLTARGIMGIIGQAGISIWSQIDVFLIVMIFGIGTDYCLFLVSRFREELGKNDSRKEAMKTAVGKVGVVITASAFAVVVGLSGMAVAKYQMIQTMGPLLGIAILITLLTALTLAPALASIFGRFLFWPRHEKHHIIKIKNARERGWWGKIVGFTTTHPLIMLGIVVIVMLLPMRALPDMKQSFDQMSEIPEESDSIKGFNVLQEHFDIGEMDPAAVIISAPAGTDLTGYQTLSAIEQISNDLRQVDGVVKVQSILHPDGSDEVRQELTVSGQLASINSNISSMMTSSNPDPTIIFSDDIDNNFILITSYLAELAENFPWVKNDTSYQSILLNLQTMKQEIDELKESALVENQLRTISSQIGQTAASMSNPSAYSPSDLSNSILMLINYLDELSGQYPDVAANSSFQQIYSTVLNMQTALANMQSASPEQQQALMAALPQYLGQLINAMDNLADSFSGSGDVLISETLTSYAGSSVLTDLQNRFVEFSGSLDKLSQAAISNGNPAFLSPTLLGSSAEAQELIGLFYSEDRSTIRFYMVLDAYPQSDSAMNIIKDAREVLNQSIKKSSLSSAEAVIGGTSAEITDVRQVIESDFNRVMIVILVAIFIVLALLLKSLVASIYLLMTVLLSYGTTLGIVTWLFQDVMGYDGISFIIPIIVFALLVALGSDYNIFLMSRVREESISRSTREGTRLAALATGGVITACGIILAGTFGALVITPIKTLLQIGVAIGVGVLLDTFLVRALLVPAIASLLGRANWWPSRKKENMFNIKQKGAG